MAKDPLQKNVQDAITGLNELKLAFEQYFMGMERVPPLDLRTKYAATLRTLKETPTRNTATKFQVNNLWSKFQTYDQMWNRILKEIEEGTYKRDKFRVGLLKKKQKATSQDPNAVPDVVELDDLDFDVEDGEEAFQAPAPAPVAARPAPAPQAAAPVAKPGVSAPPGSALAAFAQRTGVQLQARPGAPAAAPAPAGARPAPVGVPGAQPRPAGAVPVAGAAPRPGTPAPAGAPRPVAPAPVAGAPRPAGAAPAVAARPAGAPAAAARPAGGSDMPDDYVRRIEKTLSETRKKIGDQTETNFEVLKAQLTKQVPLIKQQHGAKSVEFQVVVKDGKAILKAIPKK